MPDTPYPLSPASVGVKKCAYLPLSLSEVTNRNAVSYSSESGVADQSVVPDASELFHGLVQQWIAYTTTKGLQSELAKQGKRFYETEKGQYVGVTGVDPEAFEYINKYRNTGKLSCGLRFSFQPESELLINKLPSGAHEILQSTLVENFAFVFQALGISRSGSSWIGGS